MEIPANDSQPRHLGALWGGAAFGFRHFENPFNAQGTPSASANGCGCQPSEVRDTRFRSVVRSDILSEQPATLAIILMARPAGIH